jgi:peptide/nickel transport system substrate-binding protein
MASTGYWHRFQARRISRRRLLVAGGAGAAGLAVAAACNDSKGGTSEDGTPSEAGQPVYGGRMKSARNAVFDTLDPYNSVASLNILARLYNVLMKQSALKPDLQVFDLAESLEQPSATEYIFTIRPGVMIPPNEYGVPERQMDAEDVVVAFDRIKTLPEATACAFVCNWIESHEATDAMTYKLTTPKPYAWFFLQIGGTNYFQTIPPREINEAEKIKDGGVGGGPFFVRPGGYSASERCIMDKNPVYYATGSGGGKVPFVDGWDTIVVPDPAAVRAAFESKQSFTYGARNSAEAEELLGQYEIHEGERQPLFNYISFTLNVERGPWADEKVRKAALYALNRQEYVDIIYQGDARPNGILAWSLGAYVLPEEELNQLQPYDPELSRQLIQEAGHELPLEIDVVFPTGDFIQMDQHTAIWLQQMEDAGFKVNQTPMDLGSWVTLFTAKDYDASLHPGLEYETPEFPLDFQTSKGPAGSGIFANGLEDPEVDEAVEATKSITDQDQLIAAIHDVQRLIYEKGPASIPICSAFTRDLIWDFVKNYPSGAGTTDWLNNDWWLDGAPA